MTHSPKFDSSCADLSRNDYLACREKSCEQNKLSNKSKAKSVLEIITSTASVKHFFLFISLRK